MRKLIWHACLAAVLLGALFTTSGQAAFPGYNGKILFGSYSTEWNDLFVINADGTGATRLTFNNAAGAPAWSSDGAHIAFASNYGSASYEIWVMNADGSGQHPITNNTAQDSEPVWSPDGTWIAFISNRNNPNYQIFIMNADGSDVLRLTKDGDCFNPSWGPRPKSRLAVRGETPKAGAGPGSGG